VQFIKGEPHELKKVALHVTLKCGTLYFLKNFPFCKMDEVDLILNYTIVDVLHKLVRL
jgi:hypothetical protein